jgi:hypothetical protein
MFLLPCCGWVPAFAGMTIKKICAYLKPTKRGEKKQGIKNVSISQSRGRRNQLTASQAK